MPKRAIALASVLVAVFLFGCESAFELFEADPAPVTNFLPNHKLLQRQKASFPFNRMWYKKGMDWQRFTKLKFDQVDISHMLEDDWWQKVSEVNASDMRNDAKILGDKMRGDFVRAILKSPRYELSVVNSVDEHTAVVQLALVHLVPTKAFFNAAGTIAGFFIPGASLVNTVNSGSIAMECKVLDGRNGEVVMMLTAREKDDSALIDLKSLTWYGNAETIIDRWAGYFAQMAIQKDSSGLRKEFPFSIISLPQ